MVLTRVRHVLDPLSADEIATAVRILRDQQGLPARHRFVEVVLHEPPKARVLADPEGHDTAREAHVVLLDHDAGTTYAGVVSLTAGRVRSWACIPGVQPAIALEEFDECEAACKRHPAFREALAKRGITDVDAVIVDPWSAGAYEDDGGRRLSRALTWVRLGPTDNAYAHPVEN